MYEQVLCSVSIIDDNKHVFSISTGALSSHFKAVEDNMNRRRNHIQSLLENSDETVLSITSFPRLGCPSFTYPERSPLPASSISRCLYLVLKYLSYLL